MIVLLLFLQKQNLESLLTIVRNAVEEANKNYNDAIDLRPRKTWCSDNSTAMINRRRFPDRFFLTRTQQCQRDMAWNHESLALNRFLGLISTAKTDTCAGLEFELLREQIKTAKWFEGLR